MRRLGITLGAVVLLVLASTPAMSSPIARPPDAGTDRLLVREDSDRRLAAVFGRSTVAMRVEARAQRLGRAAAEVEVGGARVTASRDLVSGTATWSGQGAVLTPAEHRGLVALADEVTATWAEPVVRAGRDLPGHADLLVRLVALAAEAPPGVELGTYAVDRPATTRETRRTLSTRPDVASCADAALARTADSSAARERALAACQTPDEEGIVLMACTRSDRPLDHDADGHCLLGEAVDSGPGSPDCLGECGPGCRGTDTYTYDCGDHDRCGRVHGGSLNPWDAECGDEYWEADDDTLWAPVNRC